MEWAAQLDLYCERTAWGLWAEPLNLASNAVFFIIAIAIGLRRERRVSVGLLALLCAAAGTGSALFHSFATVWARWLDVALIGIYVLAFVAVIARVLGATWKALALIYLVYLGTSGLVALLIPDPSASYLGTLLLCALSVRPISGRSDAAGRWMMLATACFAASIGCRALDVPLCTRLPFGTHFLWHLLNGGAVYASLLTLLALIRTR